MLFALVFLLSFYQQTQAQLTISEDFNYGTSAGNLTGQNGGSGFAAAWTGGTGGYLPTGLSFGVLSSPGGGTERFGICTPNHHRLCSFGSCIGEFSVSNDVGVQQR
jgi:hypothetical protein